MRKKNQPLLQVTRAGDEGTVHLSPWGEFDEILNFLYSYNIDANLGEIKEVEAISGYIE